MQRLEQRVTELEKLITPENGLTVFIVRFAGRCADGREHSEPMAYSTLGMDGMRWTRMPEESLDELKARATREAPRGNGGLAVLVESAA